MKQNPLFTDSTVTQGANIQTQFEIKNVTLREGEALCLKVVIDGVMNCLELTRKDDTTFIGFIWVEHRKEISYQFFIQRGGDVLYATEMKKGVAIHIIMENWLPVAGFKWKEGFSQLSTDDIELAVSSGQDSDKESADDVIGDLIDKWGL